MAVCSSWNRQMTCRALHPHSSRIGLATPKSCPLPRRWARRIRSRLVHTPTRQAVRCELVVSEGTATLAAVFATGPAIAATLAIAELWKDGDTAPATAFDIEPPEGRIGKQRNLMWVREALAKASGHFAASKLACMIIIPRRLPVS
eukprot:scaffold237_cov421-Prasinococcus_capsulatus_cf.AAC.15